MTMTWIFDLDRSVINSDHRYRTKPNGDIDLTHWKNNATRANHMADTLLPLASKWRQIAEKGDVIVVCTSRSSDHAAHTMEFLRYNGLTPDYYLSRRGSEATPDAELKVRLLKQFFGAQQDLSPHRAVMFEDHKGVRDAVFRDLGIICLNPKSCDWVTPDARN